MFADLKLHDIPNTVARAARVLGGLGVTFLNFHTSGGVAMLQAGLAGLAEGAAAAGHVPPLGLGVTVLTSDEDASAFATRLDAAIVAGCDGVVCSMHEVAAVKRARREIRSRWSPAFDSRRMIGTTNGASAHRTRSRPPAPTCSWSDAQSPRPTILRASRRRCTSPWHAQFA